jgi:hypothetical protein
MPEIGTSGLMSGDGKRGGAQASVLAPILDSTEVDFDGDSTPNGPSRRPAAEAGFEKRLLRSKARELPRELRETRRSVAAGRTRSVPPIGGIPAAVRSLGSQYGYRVDAGGLPSRQIAGRESDHGKEERDCAVCAEVNGVDTEEEARNQPRGR